MCVQSTALAASHEGRPSRAAAKMRRRRNKWALTSAGLRDGRGSTAPPGRARRCARTSGAVASTRARPVWTASAASGQAFRPRPGEAARAACARGGATAGGAGRGGDETRTPTPEARAWMRRRVRFAGREPLRGGPSGVAGSPAGRTTGLPRRWSAHQRVAQGDRDPRQVGRHRSARHPSAAHRAAARYR